MKPVAEQTLYEILEVPFDAPESEIVRAWERAEALYGPGSLSTYTLISPEEAAVMTAKLEEALDVLLDPAERVRYDARIRPRKPGLAVRRDEEPLAPRSRFEPASLPPVIPPLPQPASAGTALDRVAMLAPVGDAARRSGALAVALELVPSPDELGAPEDEDEAASDELEADAAEDATPVEAAQSNGAASHVAAVADLREAVEEADEAPTEGVAAADAPCAQLSQGEGTEGEPSEESPRHPEALAEPAEPAPILLSRVAEEAPAPILLVTLAPVSPPFAALLETAAAAPPSPAAPAPAPDGQGADAALAALVLPDGVPFTGEVLRRAREARGLSVQQLCGRTRIARHHLENIEADEREKLPAPVYLRGILMALARELRLDGQKVARSYLEAIAAQAPARDR